MKTFKQFLLEAVSKKLVLSVFKKKMNLDLPLDVLFKETLKEVFPHVIQTTDEENETILHHLVNTTKNVKLINSNPKGFITKNEIIKSSKFTIALDVHVEKYKCIVKHQFSFPEGRDFRDNEMTYLIDDINDVIRECLILLTETPDEINLDEKLGENDILYTFTAETSKTVNINGKEYLLFHIPRFIKQIDHDLSIDSLFLDHLPKYIPNVLGSFDCSSNNLKSLKGCPKKVSGDFYCYDNQLESLQYTPLVGGNYTCSSNELKSLKYGPKIVEGGFWCDGNLLPSLEFAPKITKERFICSNNLLKSLEHAPKEVGGNFSCSNNLKKFTEEEVRSVSEVKGTIFL